jgi:hypothetical protein
MTGVFFCLVCISSGISGDGTTTLKPDESSARERERSIDGRHRATSSTYGSVGSSHSADGLPTPEPAPHDWNSPLFLAFVWPKISFMSLCCFIGVVKYALRFPSLLGIPYDTPSQQSTVDRLYFFLGVCANACTLYWLYWLFKVSLAANVSYICISICSVI